MSSLDRIETLVQAGASRLRPVVPVISVAAVGLAAWLVWRALRDVDAIRILQALAATSPWAVVGAIALTAVSFGCLITAEWFAFWLVGRRLPKARAAWASFRSISVSSVMGFGLASGAAVRMRLYRWTGLRTRTVAGVSLLSTLAVYLSGFVAMGVAVFVDPAPLASAIGGPPALVSAAALLLMSPSVLWFVAFQPRTRQARSRRPSRWGRTLALAANITDWLTSGTALFVLTGQGAASLPPFLALFCLGSLAGGIAGVPAGIGVLEATLLNLHARELMHETAAGLILYRCIYYLIPLLLCGVATAVQPLLRRATSPEGREGRGRP